VLPVNGLAFVLTSLSVTKMVMLVWDQKLPKKWRPPSVAQLSTPNYMLFPFAVDTGEVVSVLLILFLVKFKAKVVLSDSVSFPPHEAQDWLLLVFPKKF